MALDFIIQRACKVGDKKSGLQLLREKSQRNAAVNITDVDFTDYLAIVAGEVDQAEKVLNHLGQDAEGVGLYCNAKAIELQIFNHKTSSGKCYDLVYFLISGLKNTTLKKFLIFFLKKGSYILGRMLTKCKISYNPLYSRTDADQTKNKKFLIPPYGLG